MLDEHAPYQRVVSDQTTATDRQWLRMLSDVFSAVSCDGLLRAGMDAEWVRSILGVVALNQRIQRDDAQG